MKLRKLHIQNVASYADVSIDFSASPLAETPLFLIAGDVGSGKSTILDAITLALYNRTPRLNDRSPRRGALDNEFEGHKANHTVNLVRRGQRNAAVTLDFEADGHLWRARWTASAKARSASLQLTNVTTGAVYEKEAHQAEVRRLTGLNFEQFCRTTVLAQGAFAEFLKANEDEKSEILEKILDDDRFSRIGRTIYRLSAEAAQKLRDTEKDIQRLTIMSPEERTAAESERLKLTDEATTVKASITQLSNEHSWIVKGIELQQQAEKAREKFETARLFYNSNEMVSMRRDISDYDLTTDARVAVSARALCNSELEKVEAQLSQQTVRFARALGRLQSSREQLLKLNTERKKINEAVEKHSTRRPIYASAKTIAKDAAAYLNTTDEKLQAENRSNEIRKDLTASLIPALEKSKGTNREANEKLKAATESYEKSRNDLEQTGLPKLRTRQKEVREQLSTFQTTGIYLGLIEKETEKAAEWQTEIEKLNARITALPAQIKSVKAEYEKLADEKNRITHELSIRRLAIEDIVVKIRARLRTGDECPVCGRPVEDHLPVDEAVQEAVAEQERGLAQIDGQVELARQQHAHLTASLDESKLNLEKAKKQQLASLELIENTKKLVTDVSLLDRDRLTACEENARARMSEIERLIDEAEKVEKYVEECRRLVERRRVEAQQADKAEQETLKLIDKKKAEAISFDSIAASKRIDAHRMFEAIVEALGGYEPYIRLARKDINTLVAVLNDEAAEYDKLMEQSGEIEKLITGLENEIDIARTSRDVIVDMLPSWAGIEPVPGNTQSRSDSEMASLKSELDILMERRRLAEERGAVAEKAIKRFLSSNQEISRGMLEHLCSLSREHVSAMRKRVSDTQTAFSNAKATLKHIEEQTDAHIAECPSRLLELSAGGQPIPRADDIKARIDECKAALDATNLRLGHLNAVLNEDDERAQQMRALLDTHHEAKALADKWATLNRMFGSEDGKRFRCIALSFVLGNLIEAANSYMEHLSDRYRLQLKAGTYVILVEDRFDGGRLRQITTLSGGETFIVSLALALALSDIGEVSGSDILFIDEGFGSLGGNDLHKAIQALQSLHSLRARRVGIISHIPEVAERIPVQIRVQRPASSALSTICIIP